MKANHRHYILLIVSILAAIAATVGYTALYYTITYHGKESSEVMSKQAIVNEKRQNVQLVSSLYEKTADERVRIAAHIVSQDKVVDFIETVEKIGTTTSSALVISAIDITEGDFKARVELEGRWENLMRSLVLLENIPYTVSLNNIRIRKEVGIGEGAKSGMWKMSLDIKTPIIK